MRTLTPVEIQATSGATLQGAFIGMLDGAATGMSIGGKWGTGGGFIVGGISQLVGLIVPTIMGGMTGLIYGAIYDTDFAMARVAEFRDSFGPGSTNNSTV